MKVFPHGELREVLPRVWTVSGSVSSNGIRRRMVVYQLPDNRLIIHSAILMNEEGMSKLRSLGTPAFLIVPNRFHRLDAGNYKILFPNIQVLSPKAAAKWVEKVVHVEGFCEDVLSQLSGVQVHEPEGLKPGELCFQFSSAEGEALVFTDILFNVPLGEGLRGWIWSKILATRGELGMTRLGRLVYLQNKEKYRDWLNRLADLPKLSAILVGHGKVIQGSECAGKLRLAASRL